jgi:hypothetical protein
MGSSLVEGALQLLVEFAQLSRSARLRAFVMVALIFGCVVLAIAAWIDN